MGYPEWSYLPEHQAIAMQDNSSIHRLRVSEEAMGHLRIQWQVDHPPQSPDLNPIEDVWNLLKRRFHQRPIAPINEAELLEATQDEWGRITPEDYLGSILSMLDRIQAMIVTRGGPTRY